MVLQRRKPDDRDHFGNKRVHTAGPLFSTLFRSLLLRAKKEFETENKSKQKNSGRKNLEYEFSCLNRTISNGIKLALSTGNWQSQKNLPPLTGVAQTLIRLTFSSTLSHLRRLIAPLSREGKQAKPRQLHNTHWGVICPAETPEGQSCGLVKNLALMTRITDYQAPGPDIEQYLSETDLIVRFNDASERTITTGTKVFINGDWVGFTERPHELVENLREQRLEFASNTMITEETAIVRDTRNMEIRISTEGGRCCRPLLVVQNNQILLQKSDILTKSFSDFAKGTIEMIDVEEEETLMISMFVGDLALSENIKFTHCEIHPAMILGVCASIIPFPDHNQSPRNTYQSAMGKQAMGIYASNFRLRFDTTGHLLFYPQKPMVRTKSMKYLNFESLPAGQNCIVAIACYSGYNQEDSIMMSQSSIDRGLFRSIFFRTYQDETREVGTKIAERFCVPSLSGVIGRRDTAAAKLDADGFIAPGTSVVGNDLIIGKIAEFKANDGNKKPPKDCSIPLRSTENGIIDEVMVCSKEVGNNSLGRVVKIRVRNVRVPQMGDKFSSRHGQKGTVGITYRQEDMPFTVDGISPDLIINPHAVPSRMTIGQLVECLLGKRGAMLGEFGDATPFEPFNLDLITDSLHQLGFTRYGNEVMYNGHTGRRLESQVFLGPTYYQRLKHMVDDKIHSRARGRVQMLTRQPLEGRSREGGLRFGEMERDCIIAHGASMFLRERLFDQSDPYQVYVCDQCGMMITNFSENLPQCRPCQNYEAISLVNLPYACKLLFQELLSMMITPRFVFDTPDEN